MLFIPNELDHVKIHMNSHILDTDTQPLPTVYEVQDVLISENGIVLVEIVALNSGVMLTIETLYLIPVEAEFDQADHQFLKDIERIDEFFDDFEV